MIKWASEVNTAGTGTRLEDLDEETEEMAAGNEEEEGEEGVNGHNNKYNGKWNRNMKVQLLMPLRISRNLRKEKMEP